MKVAAQKGDAAPGVAKRAAGNAIAMYFAAKLEGVLARGIGNVVNELEDSIGPLELRPFEPTQAGKEISTEADAGQPAGQSTRSHTCIKAVTRRRASRSPGSVGW